MAEKRRSMVVRQLEHRGIRDPRVLDAMNRLPRELFVPEDQRAGAYEDNPIGIGFDQTISQPYMTALMCESLELAGHESVLEVGSGSGYHAAVLAMLAAQVWSIEIVPELAEQAKRNLFEAGIANVRVVCGDGSLGYPEAAPYDAISVAAAAPDVPRALLGQLRDPGRMAIPVGSRGDQDLTVVTKRNGHIGRRVPTMCRFVPLRGEQGWKD
ncbi:MAG: protein-L-isoaspartate(D-aspartate) O-methyltransferase [Acidobacteria bacterium]|nr:protein-L-isoaspartate(D-aspartate) O-methyltransferase [Acidobacteriota bacterium]